MPRPRSLALVATAVLGLVLPLLPQTTYADPPAARAQAQAAPAVSHVVVVSVDGLNPVALRRLGAAGAPTFHRLMAEGAFTLNARTSFEATITLPNHTSMLTGRRINARKGGHGITVNDDPGRTVHHHSRDSYVASIFDVVHDAGGSTALYAGKERFRFYRRTWRKHGLDGSKLDTFRFQPTPARLTRKFVRDVRTDPHTFSFLHLAAPDKVGHAKGFMTTPYLDAVRRTDAQIGQVLAAIETSPTMAGRTAVVVTSDHGGKHSHLDPTKLANYRVPFFVWGPGVPAGAGLYGLNDRFRSPQKRRIAYQRPRQPIRNGLVANLSARLLGLGPVPGSTIDPAQRFTVTR